MVGSEVCPGREALHGAFRPGIPYLQDAERCARLAAGASRPAPARTLDEEGDGGGLVESHNLEDEITGCELLLLEAFMHNDLRVLDEM